jgi:hypothetical protein
VIRLEAPNHDNIVPQEWNAVEFIRSLYIEAGRLGCNTYFLTLINEDIPAKPIRKPVKMLTRTGDMDCVLVE